MQKNFLPFFVQPPELNEQVSMVTVEISSIPAGANPFRYDSVSMGSEVRHGIMMMTCDQGSGTKWPLMYMSVPQTGQQFAQVPVPVSPRYCSVIKLPVNDGSEGLVTFTGITSEGKPTFEYVSPDELDVKTIIHTPVGPMVSPVYILVDDVCVLHDVVDVTNTYELTEVLAKALFTDIDNIDEEFIEKVRGYLI